MARDRARGAASLASATRSGFAGSYTMPA
jgi:hypothetical protein